MDNEDANHKKLVQDFLAPLDSIQPATYRVPRFRKARVRHITLIALISMALLVAGAAAANQVFGPLHNATEQPEAQPVTCSGIIGQPVARAEEFFAEHNYQVSWRLEHFGSTELPGRSANEPNAVLEGKAEIVHRPPAGTIVYDAVELDEARSPKSVIAFAGYPGDPNAPKIAPPSNCP